ncbi:6789_t:CDS:2, partial [Cetraspora pellucida]
IEEKVGLNIHQSTVGCLLKQSDNNFEEMPTMKRSRAITYSELDNALYEWLLNILEGQLKFSTEWLAKFKKWHKIAKVKLYEEDASADHDAATEAIPKLRQLLSQYYSQDG